MSNPETANAEAAKELAKLGQEVLNKSEKTARFFSGPPAEYIGMWTDSLQKKRAIRQLQLIKEAQEEAESLGFSINPVQDKFMLPWLEHSSLEEDENLQNMWKNLLISNSSTQDSHPAFIEIMKSITPNEAKILKYMYENKIVLSAREDAMDFDYNLFEKMLKLVSDAGVEGPQSRKSVISMFENLYRVQLLIKESSQDNEYMPGGHNRYGTFEASIETSYDTYIAFTYLGKQFMEAVTLEQVE